MELLSEDDLNLAEMTPEELDLAWDLWFDLAQATNDDDPAYSHGVFVLHPPPSQLADAAASRAADHRRE
ncbi:MAG TPA: hypothetical protein VKY89_12085 [Thermoanaerobaculia bacterium]|jgi:hypothetical protein|nr:hypothetical protein [Thermoanaerobaculia bacterium]